MDFVEILLLLAFFGVPALVRLFEKAKTTPSGSAPGRIHRVEDVAEGWSADREAWDGEEAEEDGPPGLAPPAAPVQAAPTPMATPPEAISIEGVSAEVIPARAERTPAVVEPATPEPLVVDWAAQRILFQQRTRGEDAKSRRPSYALGARLRHRAELRDAVILSEIVGPPRALRE